MQGRELFRWSPGILSMVLAILLGGCGIFGKPALPRHASVESLRDPLLAEFESRIKRSEVIYFPVENLNDTATQVIRVLRNEAKPFAIAWQVLGIEDQNILDQLAAAPGVNAGLLDQLRWNASGPSRELDKEILRTTSDLPHLAIGLPRALRTKLQTGQELNGKERLILPDGYRAPDNDLENFAEEYAATPRRSRAPELTHLYRLHLTEKQFAAERIVSYLQQNEDAKLLVFLPRREMIGTAGVANFVAQKVNVPQLILDLASGVRERSRMLTSTNRRITHSLL